MYYSLRSWSFVVAAVLALSVLGCQPKPEEKKASGKPADTRAQSKASEKSSPKKQTEAESQPANESEAEPQATVVSPRPQEDLPPPAIREVALSDKLRATCLVNVGESLPPAELADLEGKMQSLEQLRDRKPTVVCFWTIGTSRSAQLRSIEALHDLMKEIAEPFGEKGLGVVGINVGDSAKDVQQHVAEAGATFPCLLDPKGELYAKIATDRKMPRVFMLDAGGRILWFDVEFSRPARRELLQNIRVMLEQQK